MKLTIPDIDICSAGPLQIRLTRISFVSVDAQVIRRHDVDTLHQLIKYTIVLCLVLYSSIIALDIHISVMYISDTDIHEINHI